MRETYHFGPTKISMYLKHYHDVAVSSSGVWRILKRLGMIRLPASQGYCARTGAGSGMRSSSPGTGYRST
jgi:hypothetical protein